MNIPYPKPFEEQPFIEKLLNRAHIRKNATGRKSVANDEPDRLGELLEDAAETIMNLENEVARLRSILDGTWSGSAECDLKDALFLRITDAIRPPTDEEFDQLFKRLDDRILFKFLAQYTCSINTHRNGVGYSINPDDSLNDFRAVVEQELYERLTGRE